MVSRTTFRQFFFGTFQCRSIMNVSSVGAIEYILHWLLLKSQESAFPVYVSLPLSPLTFLLLAEFLHSASYISLAFPLAVPHTGTQAVKTSVSIPKKSLVKPTFFNCTIVQSDRYLLAFPAKQQSHFLLTWFPADL